MTSTVITSDVHRAADILRKAGVVGMPTETVYGLAAIAEFEEAVARVFDIKGRPRNHPLIIHLSPTADLNHWGDFNQHATQLAKRFWPGPLTLLVPRTSRVPDWVTGGRDTVAIRVPSHPIAIALLTEVDTAVVAPSANLFGKVSPTRAEHVANDLGDAVDIVLDGGPCSVGVESTIVECVGDSVNILRPGAILRSEIEEVVGVDVGGTDGESRAPGMLVSHYAPNASVRLFSSISDALQEAEKLTEQHIAFTVIWHDDIREYAEHMYADLRHADELGHSVVLAVLPHGDGMAEAVRDRLQKAAAGH